MNILMLTNVYYPLIGGVQRSIEIFSKELRKNGNRVVIVAPEFDTKTSNENDIIRVPSLLHFNGTEFSVQIPIPGMLHSAISGFIPDLVHSHHPFMLGDTALRVAAEFNVPVVFTHHTFYEKYTHYVTENSEMLKKFIKALTTEYSNLCDLVFAPSASVAKEIDRRGVKAPIKILPTGIDTDAFNNGSGKQFRNRFNIHHDATVLGFVSRIAPEKNIEFLCKTVKKLMHQNEKISFLAVGNGPSEEYLIKEFSTPEFIHRFIFTGSMIGQELIDAYHAMDLFVFTSLTETQGLVVIEAMAAGVPVVAVRGPGVEDVVGDLQNGRIVDEKVDAFVDACLWYFHMNETQKHLIRRNAVSTAETYSKDICVKAATDEYLKLLEIKPKMKDVTAWQKIKRIAAAELELCKIFTKASGIALTQKI